MIAPTTDRQVEHHLNTPAQDFQITATREAFEILSGGLYSNRPAAILRELGTNAQDAHIEAGKAQTPFKVTLPTTYSPELHIIDYGTGMTHETVMGLYSTYFASTKTTSNAQTGAFGLGSKTPLSMVDAFTVTTRTQGETTGRQYLIGIGAEGTPTVTFVGHLDTEVGTTITVPIPEAQHNAFTTEVGQAYQYFEPQPTLNLPGLHLDGWTTHRFTTPQGQHYAAKRNLYNRHFTVVQGPVGYKVAYRDVGLAAGQADYRLSNGQDVDDYELTFTVPMGTLLPSASRETISLTDQSVAYLRRTAVHYLERAITHERVRQLHNKRPAATALREDVDKNHWEAYLTKNVPKTDQTTVLDYAKGRFTGAYEATIYTLKGNKLHRKTDPYTVRKIVPTKLHLITKAQAKVHDRRVRPYLYDGSLSRDGLITVVFEKRKTLERWVNRMTSHLPTDLIEVWDKDNYPTKRRTTGTPFGKSTPPAAYYLQTPDGYERRLNRNEVLNLIKAGDTILSTHVKGSNPYPEKTTYYLHVDYEYRNRETRTKAFEKITAHMDEQYARLKAVHKAELLTQYTTRQLVWAAAVQYLRGTTLETIHRGWKNGYVDNTTIGRIMAHLPTEPWKGPIPDEYRQKGRRLVASFERWIDKNYPLTGRYTNATLSDEVFAYIVGKELTKDTPTTGEGEHE